MANAGPRTFRRHENWKCECHKPSRGYTRHPRAADCGLLRHNYTFIIRIPRGSTASFRNYRQIGSSTTRVNSADVARGGYRSLSAKHWCCRRNMDTGPIGSLTEETMASEPLRLRVTQLPAPSGKGKVLMVDEDSKDLGLYRSALEREGFEVITSTSFVGRTVLDHALKADRHRPVLVITRCIDMQCYLEAMQMGAVDYLEKPLAPGELLRFVETHVQHERLQMLGGAAS